MTTTIPTPQTTISRAARLIAAATGDEYGGDNRIVDGYGIGYADGDADTVWVSGDWNDVTDYDSETRTFTTRDDTPSRLGRALERIGVQLEWLDCGHTCDGCQLWVHTEPDSYSWLPDHAVIGDSFLCGECIRQDPEELFGEYVNNPDTAITAALLGDLDPTDYGFQRHPDDDAPDYESGWYPGQTDNPHEIAEAIRGKYGDDVEIVFIITGTGQFDLQFAAYWRAPDHEEVAELAELADDATESYVGAYYAWAEGRTDDAAEAADSAAELARQARELRDELAPNSVADYYVDIVADAAETSARLIAS